MSKNKVAKNCYNIIFAGGNIPPMTASLLSVENGYPTYVYTDRGRSFNGIELVDNFHNMGFDVNKTQSVDDEKSFAAAVNTVKNIKSTDENAYFLFYTGESRGFKCAAIAANAGLSVEGFHIFMLEDGIDSYKKFAQNYGENAAYEEIYASVFDFLYNLTNRKWFSRQIAEKITVKVKQAACRKGFIAGLAKNYTDSLFQNRFRKSVKRTEKYFAKIMQGNNKSDDKLFSADYRWPFALACMENYTYYLQDKSKIYDILKSIDNPYMSELFDVKGYGEKSVPEVEYKNLADRIMGLDREKRGRYLALMFGRYGEEVKQVLGRTTRADIPAPNKKLIYVNARYDTMFACPTTNKIYGIGAIGANVPDSYANLEEKYKSVFLFAEENDYNILLDEFKKLEEYADAPQETVAQAKARVFNMYSDYIFTAKLVYILYGETYDIIVKNHPRTDIGTSDEWTGYTLKYGEGKMLNYGKALDNALKNFHQKDTIGRYIGIINGSLSTECFEYTDADVSFAGQPSSVYNGLSDNAQIPFILADSDLDITGGGDAHVAYSAVSGRYTAGKMKYISSEDNVENTVFFNTGNILKGCAVAAEKTGNSSLAEFYTVQFDRWRERTYPTAKDIDAQGFAILD